MSHAPSIDLPESVQSIIGAVQNFHALAPLTDSDLLSGPACSFLLRSCLINERFPGILQAEGVHCSPGRRLVPPMGSILARKRQDGTTGYTARVRIKRGGKIVHTEAATFSRKQEAIAWLKKRETILEAPGALEKLKAPDPTLAAVIERYIKESSRDLGKTKQQVLRTIKESDLGAMASSSIGSSEIVAFAKSLGVQPQTVGNYLSHLSSIFAVARPAWGYPLDQQAMKDAVSVTKRLGMTSKSLQRNRRPTLAELDLIMTFFGERQERRAASAPMQAIVAFAIFSTRRQEEITRITWADMDEAHSRIMVRDMKNPGQKKGNDVWCDLTPEAIRLIKAMPRTSDLIFPFGTDAISASFTRAMKMLGIEDLHFHDLRREGVSRLFEMGWSIPRVAQVSGHRSWDSLKVYTQIKAMGDKYGGWKWLDKLTSPAPATAGGAK